MKKIFFTLVIVLLLSAAAIVALAEMESSSGPNLKMPLIIAQTNQMRSFQTDEEDTCGLTPEVFELTDSQGASVGQLSVRNDRRHIYIDYQLSGDWCMVSNNLEVAPSLEAIPQQDGSPLPDQFEFGSESTQCIQSQTFVVPIIPDRKFAEKLFIAATADIQDSKSGALDDAWTTCTPFPANDGSGYCNYSVEFEEHKPFSMAVGFEDLRMTDSDVDFDYNDWLADLDGTINYCRTMTERLGVTSIEFNVTPETRGAALDHVFHLRFHPNTFLSDGRSTLTIRDENGLVVGGHVDQPFVSAAENDFTVIPFTSQAFPGSLVNTYEDRPHVPTMRTATLLLQFDQMTPLDLESSGPDLPLNVHGANLFFDPYLFVLRRAGPQYAITQGDVRMLIMPSSTLSWAEERIAVWEAYPDVIPGDKVATPKIPPTFPANWWMNYNDCVYNGVPCSVSASSAFIGDPYPGP